MNDLYQHILNEAEEKSLDEKLSLYEGYLKRLSQMVGSYEQKLIIKQSEIEPGVWFDPDGVQDLANDMESISKDSQFHPNNL